MNFIYTYIMKFLVGEALANSDRMKVGVMSVVTIALTNLAGACTVCQALLTPAVVNAISVTVGGWALSMILALTKRDVAAPGQSVAGAANWTLPADPGTGVPQPPA